MNHWLVTRKKIYSSNSKKLQWLYNLFYFSITSNSVANITSDNKYPTALILETVEENNETVHYLVPKHLAKKGRLKKRGTKIHICQDHLFMAKHIKRYINLAKSRLYFSWKRRRIWYTHESIKKKTNIVSAFMLPTLTSSLRICQRTSSMGYGISRREYY